MLEIVQTERELMAALTGKVALNPRLWAFIKETLFPFIHPSIPAQSVRGTVDPAGSGAGEQPERNSVRIMD